jgi:hypothetical protein
MERIVDEDDCDDNKEIFIVSLDCYDLETNLLDTFNNNLLHLFTFKMPTFILLI